MLPSQNPPTLSDIASWLSDSRSGIDKVALKAALDGSAGKLKVFNHVLAMSRASRVGRLQPMLAMIESRLVGSPDSEGLLARIQDPMALIAVGKFLVDLQEKDATYVAAVSNDSDLADLREAVSKLDGAPRQPSGSFADLTPDSRERIRVAVTKLYKSVATSAEQPGPGETATEDTTGK